MIIVNKPDYTLLGKIVEHYEGYSAMAYPDTGGVITIGFGSTYNFDRNRKVRMGDFITREIAENWLEIEFEIVVKQLNHYIKVPLKTHQATALVDYIYNRGIGNMLKTRLDDLINKNPNDPRIRQEILSTGLRDRMGNLLWGLGRRRRTEANLYFTGELKFNFKRWG